MVKTARQELSDFVEFDELTGPSGNFTPVEGRAYTFRGYVHEFKVTSDSKSSQMYTAEVGKSPANVLGIERDKVVLLEVFGAEAMDDGTFRKNRLDVLKDSKAKGRQVEFRGQVLGKEAPYNFRAYTLNPRDA